MSDKWGSCWVDGWLRIRWSPWQGCENGCHELIWLVVGQFSYLDMFSLFHTGILLSSSWRVSWSCVWHHPFSLSSCSAVCLSVSSILSPAASFSHSQEESYSESLSITPLPVCSSSAQISGSTLSFGLVDDVLMNHVLNSSQHSSQVPFSWAGYLSHWNSRVSRINMEGR